MLNYIIFQFRHFSSIKYLFLKQIKKTKQKTFKPHKYKKKSPIRETPTLSTDADSRSNTNLKRLRGQSLRKKRRKKGCVIDQKKNIKK